MPVKWLTISFDSTAHPLGERGRGLKIIRWVSLRFRPAISGHGGRRIDNPRRRPARHPLGIDVIRPCQLGKRNPPASRFPRHRVNRLAHVIRRGPNVVYRSPAITIDLGPRRIANESRIRGKEIPPEVWERTVQAFTRARGGVDSGITCDLASRVIRGEAESGVEARGLSEAVVPPGRRCPNPRQRVHLQLVERVILSKLGCERPWG